MERKVRKAAGRISMVLMSGALMPVVKRDNFSKQRRPRDERKREGPKFYRILEEEMDFVTEDLIHEKGKFINLTA